MTSTITLADSSPAATLRACAAESWEAATDHRFVRELFAGTVDDEVLSAYLVQDYQFFDSFLSMLGACVAYADQPAAKLRFARQLGMLAADENDYFRSAFDELGVPAVDRRDPLLTVTTEEFVEAMDAATDSRSYAHLLVVLGIAEWLYLDWGERPDPLPGRAVHSGWILLHRGEDFRGWVQFLVDELNRVFPADRAQAERLTATWQHVVGLELAFFDAAYH